MRNEKQLAQQREAHRRAALAQEDEGERKARFELCTKESTSERCPTANTPPDSGASDLTVLRREYENTNRNRTDTGQHDGIR